MAALFGVHIGNSSVCLAICKDVRKVMNINNKKFSSFSSYTCSNQQT